MVKYLSANPGAENIDILLMFAAGIRVGELVALNKHDGFDGDIIKSGRTEIRFSGEGGRYVYSVKEFPQDEAGAGTVVIPKDSVWSYLRWKLYNLVLSYRKTYGGVYSDVWKKKGRWDEN